VLKVDKIFFMCWVLLGFFRFVFVLPYTTAINTTFKNLSKDIHNLYSLIEWPPKSENLLESDKK